MGEETLMVYYMIGAIAAILLPRLLWPWWSRANEIIKQNDEILTQLRIMNGESLEDIEKEKSSKKSEKEKIEKNEDPNTPW